jgi:hypothetical protein
MALARQLNPAPPRWVTWALVVLAVVAAAGLIIQGLVLATLAQWPTATRDEVCAQLAVLDGRAGLPPPGPPC